MSEAARPRLLDSRRLTGPNRLSSGPGALITVRLPVDAEALIERWRRHARRLLVTFGWHGSELHVRRQKDEADLVFDAPPDVLYTATDVNEWAWDLAMAEWAGEDPRGGEAEEGRLKRLLSEESNPRLLRLRAAAVERNVTFLSDDDIVSVGTGTGCLSWPVDNLPAPREVDWETVHDIPVAMVTGSNGKTTTVRLLAEIGRRAGHRVGYCCTDGIYHQGVLKERGDWSGPGGGRAVLRDASIDLAVLEAARGGILRRGLATERARAAAVTNVAADHLGEWGVNDVDAVAEAKLTVAKAVPAGALVINADDPVLTSMVDRRRLEHIPVSIERAADGSGVSWGVLDGAVVRRSQKGLVQIAEVDAIPIADGGLARFNVYNALCAAALADLIGVSAGDIRAGLCSFQADVHANPGRSNRLSVGGVEVLVDFAHNPHGVRALSRWAVGIQASRRLTMVGQAGDRDDESIRGLAAATLEMAPDLVVVKAMADHRRGRALGEVPNLLRRALLNAGLPPDHLEQADSELGAVRLLLQRARTGDLLVLPVQASRDGVLGLLQALTASGWRAGDPLG